MSLSTQHIIKHLFRVESFEEVSLQQLEQLVEEYPSFGVGRYLLSRKLLAENADHFTEETHRTNLYFTNPFWLQWLLQPDAQAGVAAPVHVEEKNVPEGSSVHEEIVTEGYPGGQEEWQAAPEGTLTAQEDPGAALQEHLQHEEQPMTQAVQEHVQYEEQSMTQAVQEHLQHEEQPVTQAMQEHAQPEEQPVAQTVQEHAQHEEQSMTQPEEWNAAGDAALPAEEVFAPVVDTTEPTVGPSAADELMKSIAAFQEQRRAEQTPVVQEEESPSMGIAGLALEQAEEEEHKVPDEQGPIEEITSVEEQTAVSTAVAAEEPAPIRQPEEQVTAEAGETVPTAPDHVEEIARQQTAQVDASVAASIREAFSQGFPAGESHNGEKKPDEASQEAVFEPYHTVDYFASQGIRLVVDENPTDRLGIQMKSFTDWLKVMRRLPQKNRAIIPDIAAEHQVQAIAAHSIEQREVITETMAEVLAMQGMREKATEMYRKLSLLEPEKSAYFAEKIEQLKII